MNSIVEAALARKREKQQQTLQDTRTALQESGSVAEEDIEEVTALEATKINGEEVPPVPVVESFSSADELHKSPVWNRMSIMERLAANKAYARREALGGIEPSILQPQVPAEHEVPSAPKLEDDPLVVSGTLAVQDRPKVAALHGSEALFLKYPSYNALKTSKEFLGLSIVDRTLMAREYAKQAQILAQEALQAVRGGEREILKEEQNKAIEQGALTVLSGDISQKHEAFDLSIELNERQKLGVEYAKAGKSFVYTGAAGTGKTTGCREIAKALMLQRDSLGYHTFKTEGGERVSGPGIAFCAYTRRATANIRRALHKDEKLEHRLAENVVTIHRLLEFQPEWYPDPENPSGPNKMRFIPMRTAGNPLDLKVLVIEEASMLGLDLYEKLYEALRPGTVLIFVGDINQLKPVFGKSIMNYALAQLPVVELTEVYRQALDSGIIVDAHKVLKGEAPAGNKDVVIVEGNAKDPKTGMPVQTGQVKMSRAMGAFFKDMWKHKEYDPNQDIVLSPWNKQPMGTDNINNWIAQFLGEERNAMIYEVLTNRRKMYLAVGDRVMYEKQDGIIVRISHNAQYLGKMPQPASTSLTRFGVHKLIENAESEDFDLTGSSASGYENINIDEIPDEERKSQASHVIDIKLDSGDVETLSATGDFGEAKFSLGYCLTVHKAQGCEWRKVYILLHKDHAIGGFLSRELVYTAMTRAREKLVIIAKKNILAKAVQNQDIKGDTLAEKIASINAGAVNIGSYPVIKPKRPTTH